jgi:hypothetical protein
MLIPLPFIRNLIVKLVSYAGLGQEIQRVDA